MILNQSRSNTLYFILTAIILILLWIPTQTASAATTQINFPNGGGKNVCTNMDTVNVLTEKGNPVTVVNCRDEYITFNADAYNKGTPESQKDLLNSYVYALNTASIDEPLREEAMDKVANQNSEINRAMIAIVMDNTSADVYEASKIVNPFLPIVRIIFGIMTIIISILLIGSTIVDLVFLNFPLAREYFNKDGGGGNIPLVTHEAKSVLNEVEGNGGGEYQNAIWLYFKRRFVSYIVLAFCLLWLVLGEIGGLISWLMGLGDGLIK